MKKLVYVIFFVQLISGCGLSSEPETPEGLGSEPETSESSLLAELDNALNAELITPEGRLRSVVVYGAGYQQNSYQPDTHIDIYYPAEGNKDYRVIRDGDLDTVSIAINYLQPSNNDNILEALTYSYESGLPAWTSTREYEYDSGNKLTSIYHVSPTKERPLLARHLYNHKDLLEQIEYPFQNDAEVTAFEYDEEEKIISSKKFILSVPDHVMEKYYYRYQNELLEAKETGQFASESQERQDAIQYFYDSTGRMILQKEFDPYFGFQQISKTEYYYY